MGDLKQTVRARALIETVIVCDHVSLPLHPGEHWLWRNFGTVNACPRISR